MIPTSGVTARINCFGGHQSWEKNVYGVPNFLWDGTRRQAAKWFIDQITECYYLGYTSIEINLPCGALLGKPPVDDSLLTIRAARPNYLKALRDAVYHSHSLGLPIGYYTGPYSSPEELRFSRRMGFDWVGIDGGFPHHGEIRDTVEKSGVDAIFEGADNWFLPIPRLTRWNQLFEGGTLARLRGNATFTGPELGNPTFALVQAKTPEQLYERAALLHKRLFRLIIDGPTRLTYSQVKALSW